MSKRALMMIAREDDIPGFNFDSPQNVWKRVRSESKGVVLFRHFDGDPETVKRGVVKCLNLAQKTMYGGFNVEQVSSCLISAIMNVMPVRAAWCPLQEADIAQISPVFHYLLILDSVHGNWHLYWWKLKEDDFGENTWTFQADLRVRTSNDSMYLEIYDVVEEFIYRKLP